MSRNGIAKIFAGAGKEVVVVVQKRSFAMADRSDRKVHLHYNHTDPCKHRRWTAKECYEYMYGRPWERVGEFYSDLVQGHSSFSSLFGAEKHPFQDVTENCGGFEGTDSLAVPSKDRSGRWERLTYKLVLSYHGGSFNGWQKQPGLNTVQGLVEKSIGRFIDENKAQQLKEKCLPIEGCVSVAGRTDKGVTAHRQVCSFYTWRKDVDCRDIEVAINNAAPGKLRALSVSKVGIPSIIRCLSTWAIQVSRVFHPNFSAKWRRYFYIFPLGNGEKEVIGGFERDCSSTYNGLMNDEQNNWVKREEESIRSSTACDGDDSDAFNNLRKPSYFSISKVNQLLLQLEGKSLSYKMFARDTKASRSIGPATECYVFHARAAEARAPSTDKACIGGLRLMCIELVANRFLRRMVRVLVATAIREAAAGANDDALLKLIDATCRRATAPPAPPDGLCLADVGYGEFKQENCLIL